MTSDYLVIYLSSYISTPFVCTLLVTDLRLDLGLNPFPMTSLRTPVRANSLSRFSAPLESISCALFCVFLHFFALGKKVTLLISISCALFAKEPGRREVVHSLTTHLRGRFRFRFLKKDYPVVGAPPWRAPLLGKIVSARAVLLFSQQA